MTRRKAILLACAFAVAATATGLIVRWQGSQPRFAWDFRRGRTSASLGIPKRTHPFNQFHHITVHGRVVAYFDGGHIFDESVMLATFTQHDVFGVVDSISFDLEPQTADEAFATATKFAREWNLRTDPLIEWYENARTDKHEYGQTIRNDLRPTVAVEVFSTYRHDKPFRVMLLVGWPSWDQPATRPTSAPANESTGSLATSNHSAIAGVCAFLSVVVTLVLLKQRRIVSETLRALWIDVMSFKNATKLVNGLCWASVAVFIFAGVGWCVLYSLGFIVELFYFWWYPYHDTFPHRGFIITMTAAAILPLARIASVYAHRVQPGKCPSCSYDIRASPDRCPECGSIWSQLGKGINPPN